MPGSVLQSDIGSGRGSRAGDVLASARLAHGTIDPTSAIAFSLVFALVLFLPAILNDSDTLWQIRAGEWILDHRAIPATDPFSFTAGDRHWFAHEWLAETIMALAFRGAGMAGVMALAASAAGLTAAILLHHLRRFLPGIYAMLGLVVALSNAAPSLLARPHLLAWPCLALWCGGLVTARANHTAPSSRLLPVMLLWVNLHGSFMVGLLLPAAFLVEALFDRATKPRETLVGWTGFILAAWLVALFNPDVLGGLLFPFHMLGMRSLSWIGEWQPTDFSHLQLLDLVILASLALGLSGKVRLPPIRLLIFLGLVHGALMHSRNEQLLGIVGALILAEPLGASLGRGHAAVLGPNGRRVATGAVVGAMLALAIRFGVPLDPQHSGAAFAAVLDRVPPSLRAKPVLNEYGLGGDLIFQGVHPFIDSRADLHGDAFLIEYHRIISPDRAALDRVLSERAIAWTIFPAEQQIVSLLDHEPGWRRLVEIDGLVIHARDESLSR
jgi:hypothetical protein